MAKKKKHPAIRLRRVNKTDRGALHTQIIPNKKKQEKKEWCRKNCNTE